VSGPSSRLLLVALLIVLNGFFAGAEVSLLSVRGSRLRELADEGVAGAQAALNLLANPGRLLSVTQVGVTLTSLGLGWAGEETVYEVLLRLLQPVLTPSTSHFLHGLAFVLSFLVISYLHVVLGEVVPKNLAIDKADRLAVLVAPALLLFGRISAPFVFVLERSADALSRLIGVRSVHQDGGHSPDELKLIVTSSRGLGFLPERQEDMIHRVLDLGSILVREVMVPRKDMKAIPSDSTLEEVLLAMIDIGHSRLPVYERSPEKVVGILHYKDLLPVWAERRRSIRTGRPSRPFRLDRIMRKPYVAPETKPLLQMLEEFRLGKSHIAMVVDEFGTIVGMLTVEDVLEQIVGRIEDEHDEKSERPDAEAADVELDGATRLRDLETEYGIQLPTDGGFETLAGFLLDRWGVIPRAGDRFDYQGRRYTVLEMERNRIARVHIERLPAEPASSEAG
jgi:CBS domain containing-hemolysin-like protein